MNFCTAQMRVGTQMRGVIVEIDRNFGTIGAVDVRQAGFAVDSIDRLEDAGAALHAARHSLFLLDRQLPGDDGFEMQGQTRHDTR